VRRKKKEKEKEEEREIGEKSGFLNYNTFQYPPYRSFDIVCLIWIYPSFLIHDMEPSYNSYARVASLPKS
jgi:hypothetical protein